MPMPAPPMTLLTVARSLSLGVPVTPVLTARHRLLHVVARPVEQRHQNGRHRRDGARVRLWRNRIRAVGVGGLFSVTLPLLGLFHLGTGDDEEADKAVADVTKGDKQDKDDKEDKDEGVLKKAGARLDGLKEVSMDEVREHYNKASGIWVTYKSGVYDITDFIPRHPGSKDIAMAAGGPLEPFWNLYAVHLDNPQVYELLEKCRVANLRPQDVEENAKLLETDDPFLMEPRNERSHILVPVTEKPFNAEPPAELLWRNFLTPLDHFYVRNHLPVPDVDPSQYRLEITGLGVGETLVLTLEELKQFPKVTVTATIQCGGNRRAEMMEANKDRPTKGNPWRAGACGNAEWSGTRLCDVLKVTGADWERATAAGAAHVRFSGCDAGVDGSKYGASVPLYKAFSPDVLLAYEMNGEALSRDHGFPLRAMVPGVVGARSVKWLSSIELSAEESESHWQQRDYKVFGPEVGWESVEEIAASTPAIVDMPVNSAVCEPPDGAVVEPGILKVRGYAVSGGGNRINRVDVTSDGGVTWVDAKFLHQDEDQVPRHYAWTLWEADLEVKAEKEAEGSLEVWCRAVDSANNTQPEDFRHIWNIRGLLANAYSKKKYTVVQKGGKKKGS